MRNVILDKAVRAMTFVCVFALGMFAAWAAGDFLRARQASQTLMGELAGKYEIRSRLLAEATDFIGACSPEAAAQAWSEGLKRRSAALQYAVMTKALKDEYARDLEDTFPNWVTGVSSPWVEQYNMVKKEQVDDNTYRIQIRFAAATSAGPAGNYDARLTVARDGNYWRVSKVEADRELDAYTGFGR